MRRTLQLTMFAMGLLALGSQIAVVAQDKKEKPKAEKAKGPPRIAIDDPAKLKGDPDFAAQGEYVGEGADKSKWGAHVIAKGVGTFDVVFYKGGLPGAGWDGKATKTAKGMTKDGSVEIREGDKVVATLANEVITNTDSKGYTLKKTKRKSPTLGAAPPANAVVLFAKPFDVNNWAGGKIIKLSDGEFLNYGIKSNQVFGSFTAHIEFRLPWMPNSRGQGRGNSGVYLQDRYETQVLDSFGLSGENNECGGIYTQHKPLVNMCLPPLTWQTYDIDFTQAEFDAAGKKTKPARLTVIHNGVKIHDNVELKGNTPGGQPENPKAGPIQLQNHGDPLAYRNIWVVEKK